MQTMGKFDFDIPDDFLRQLGRLENIQEVTLRMLDGAAPILVNRIKDACARHVITGAMRDSIKQTKAQTSAKGRTYVTVRPTGRDKNGIRNMEKLAWAEFGSSRQPATPILTKAVADCQQEVLQKMQEIFEEEMKQ